MGRTFRYVAQPAGEHFARKTEKTVVLLHAVSADLGLVQEQSLLHDIDGVLRAKTGISSAAVAIGIRFNG